MIENDNQMTEDVDQLYDRIMGKGEDVEGSTGTTTEVETKQASVAPQVTPQTPDDFEFQWNGRQIKSTRENILKWASQGYDYSQKMADFNKRLQDVDAKYGQYEKLKETYGPVDEWVSKNPDKWDALQKAIQGVEASGTNPQLLQKLQALEAQVLQANKFIETVQQKEERERIAKEDSELETEIKSIQEKYKDLDWKTVDENGRGLEYRVIEHGIKNGINSFRASFNDMLHDDLLKAAEVRGRESLTKERQVKQANGVVGTSTTPTKGLKKTVDLKGKSYDDLKWEALEELGLSQ
jgi:predicted  nucleic acid-binding Zn-ribbon protein